MKFDVTADALAALATGFSLVSFLAPSARAVEGGLARPISGGQLNPFAGVVPPEPGFVLGVGELYYAGSIGGNTTVPIARSLAVNVDMKASFTPISFLYIWNTGTNRWNIASALTLPLAWVEAKANVTLGPRTGHRSDSQFGLYDLLLTPFEASYHITPTDHLALGFNVWTPSGRYDPDRLANLSLNNWTFVPNLAYTKIFPKPNIELTGFWAPNFYTENPATDYQNGIESDLELLAIRRFKCGGGIGIIGSWIDQISEDQGPTASKLNGFSGHALGVGPIVTYSKQFGKSALSLNGRWVHEFDTSNRVEGDLFALSAEWTF